MEKGEKNVHREKKNYNVRGCTMGSGRIMYKRVS